ncbi:hypothetical protein GK047_20125 [Paenibacillus sp. SYP-B3998]|uniref:Uncharacterized protein n=1 Tax=Paenibacillus sp. SYP-B3998 TaxID=2678564 RepID=A0A6G4A1G4_9BACL|nr:hypothetical protein [Paenibacillus sp. SYP-B3998]NEW08313.1 hypothetical protein [Paenibacillus sp. SYP-B3998]
MEQTVFRGCGCNFLDPLTLQHRWFGAVWTCKNKAQFLLGYWFADNRDKLMALMQLEGWGKTSLEANPLEVKKAYQVFRAAQHKQDWEHRSLLPLRLAFIEPWKRVKLGWYIVKSNEGYPAHVSAVQKKRLLLWLEHVALCENEEQLEQFIHQVNLRHQIALKNVPFRTCKR